MTEQFASVLAGSQFSSQYGRSLISEGRDTGIPMTSIEECVGVIVRRWDS
jgi:hypothetical protein